MNKGFVGRRGVLLGLGLGLGLGAVGCSSVAPGAATAVAQDYSAALRDSLRPFTGDLAGYRYRGTPLGSFGVGSIYLDDVQRVDPLRAESGWYLGGPENWLAAGRPDATRVEWRERLITQGSYGAFQLGAERRRDLEAALGAAVFVAIGVGAKLDYAQGAQLSFRAGEVRNRRLNWAEFSTALASGLIAAPVAEVVRRGNFVIAAADLVLLDYSAEVLVDESLNPSLAATLRSKTAQPRIKAPAAGASLSLREATRGRFIASSSQPLVAAVLFKQPPPRTKSQALAVDIAAWPTADLANSAVDAVESRVLQTAL